MNVRICDMHVHLMGFERSRTGCFLRPEKFPRRLSKILGESFGVTDGDLGQTGIDDRIASFVLDNLDHSLLDHAVFLALDAIYDVNGRLLEDQTVYHVNNDYVARITSRNRKAFFGASIHPYRRDAVRELERLSRLGACLVKWLPSAQLIDLSHAKCQDFYDALCALDIPLLCHTGTEHVIPGGGTHMNEPALLRFPLERGVTVIAAHCGARLFITETDYFQQWSQLALEYPGLYGDISAFGFPLRRRALQKILQNPVLVDRILFGSDFPSPTMPFSFLGQIKLAEIRRLSSLSNPFDKAVSTMVSAGVPAACFSRPYPVLHLDRVLSTP